MVDVGKDLDLLVLQGYLLDKGLDENGEKLYSINYMKHPEATPEEENDFVMMRLPSGQVVQGLRKYVEEWKACEELLDTEA